MCVSERGNVLDGILVLFVGLVVSVHLCNTEAWVVVALDVVEFKHVDVDLVVVDLALDLVNFQFRQLELLLAHIRNRTVRI